jgi:hypothetical protein
MQLIERCKRFLMALALLGCMDSGYAYATIVVSPGDYELAGFLYSDARGTTLVVNPKGAAECRLKLKGPVVAKLRFQGAKVLHVKIRIAQKVDGRRGVAELLSYREIGSTEKVTVWAGNDLVPATD